MSDRRAGQAVSGLLIAFDLAVVFFGLAFANLLLDLAATILACR